MKNKAIKFSFSVMTLMALTAGASLVELIPHMQQSGISLGVIAGAFGYSRLRKLVADKFEYKFLKEK